uniref:Yip1 domain-containing protein n=1 Tax=Eiseniibacteriota bacterium TaxID=2212470 RepID=A0A832I2X0_UNCEI
MRDRVPLPFRSWAVLPWLAFVAWLWWRAALERLAATGAAPAGAGGPDPAALALAATGMKLAGHALEAAWYAACGRALGARLPVVRLAVALVTLSMLDVARLALLGPPAGEGFDPRLPLVGAELLAGAGAPHDGFGAAFGSFGLFVALRLAGTAWLLARALGEGRGGAAALLVAATWLASRLAAWWVVDLARGRSPLGGG